MSSRHYYPIGNPQRVELGSDAIPALRLAPDLPGDTRRFPGLILQHGYGADKFDLEPLAESLAEAGMVVFLPDAWGHGERLDPRGPNWHTNPSSDYFIAVVQHVLADLLVLVDVVRQDGQVDPARVWLGGFSLGGITAILATEQDSSVAGLLAFAGGVDPETVMAPLGMPMATEASAQWVRIHDMGLPEHAARLAPRPVLLVHGQNDQRLPAAGSLRLYQAAQPSYQGIEERLKLALMPGVHEITPAMLREALSWLAANVDPEITASA